METNKLEQVLKSRKVWASAIALLLLSLLYYFDAITGETYAWGVTIAVSVFTGAVALEDGLSSLFVGLAMELERGARGEGRQASKPIQSPGVTPARTVMDVIPSAKVYMNPFDLLRLAEQRWPAAPPARHTLIVDDQGQLKLTMIFLDEWREFDISADMDQTAGDVIDEIARCMDEVDTGGEQVAQATAGDEDNE